MYVAVCFGVMVPYETGVTVDMTDATDFNRINCKTFVCRDPSHPNHHVVYIQRYKDSSFLKGGY